MRNARKGPIQTLSSIPVPFAGSNLPRIGINMNQGSDQGPVNVSAVRRGKSLCASSIGHKYPASRRLARPQALTNTSNANADRRVQLRQAAYSPIQNTQ